MKYTMLLVSQSYSTSVSLRSYLNSIFAKYIDLEVCLAADLNTAIMEHFDLVLFASKEAASLAAPFLSPKIHYLNCIRTFNHTYLGRIFAIPTNSDVYLVNDSESTVQASLEMLTSLGITQYHFIPFYPGSGEVDYSIRYAVTMGETRLVPKNIPHVVDIGARIADISTISEIASFFDLPMKLADVVTSNYTNQFVQLLKVTNHQLSQAANTKFLTQSIIKNIKTGVCILNGDGVISVINKPFTDALSLDKPHLIGTPIRDAIPEVAKWLNNPQDVPVLSVNTGEGVFELTLQKIEDENHEKHTLIHCSAPENDRNVAESGKKADKNPVSEGKQARAIYNFSDYMSVNPRELAMLETAKRISLTDYRVLLQGENGTGKEVLAQAIHNNSGRSGKPFLKMNLGALSEQQALFEFVPQKDGGGGALEKAGGGTLYLNGIHHLTDRLQRQFMYILDEEPNIRFIFSADCDLYRLCEEGKFQAELFYQMNEVSLSTTPIRKRPEDIPLLFEYFLRNTYNNPYLSWKELCSEELCRQLLKYSWPGNGTEIENLCKYFSCIKNNRKLSLKDLPTYMLDQILERQEKLTPLERQLLILIEQNPKIGRSRLYQLLQEQGVEVTEGKIRSILQLLAEKNLIKMNRTKGGCEITEDGEILI